MLEIIQSNNYNGPMSTLLSLNISVSKESDTRSGGPTRCSKGGEGITQMTRHILAINVHMMTNLAMFGTLVHTEAL